MAERDIILNESKGQQQPMYRVKKASDLSNLKQYFRGESNPEQIGLRLFSIRKSLGITQEDMAASLNISTSGYRRLENGAALPSGTILIMMHELYGINILWLLYGVHSTHSDILNALSSESEQVKFDIFTRLYSYFSTHDSRSFLLNNGEGKAVEHFAAWDGAYFVPVSTEVSSDEKEYPNGGVFDVAYEEYIKTYMPDSVKHFKALMELFKIEL